MKPARILLFLALAALVVVALVNKCGSGDAAAGAPGGPGKGMGPLIATGVVVSPQRVAEHAETTGSLLANNQVEVRNEVAGRLVHLYFKEGAHVEQGELLVKIYDDDLQAQMRKLALEKEMADRTEERQKDLLSVNGISRQEYDAAQNSVSALQADIDLLRAQIAKTEIRAPFSGVVGLRTVSEGAYLASFTTIATLQQLEPMKLEFSLPERYRGRLKAGDTVSFRVGSAPNAFTGEIYAFEPMVDERTRSLKVRALCRNGGGQLLPGSFAKVDVALREIDGALMVPTQAIIPELRGQKVMTSRGGKATPVKVEIGLRNDSTVQVTSGLHAGDTVLITGIMQARPDMPVKVNVVHAGAK